MLSKKTLIALLVVIMVLLVTGFSLNALSNNREQKLKSEIEDLVYKQARAWETGDEILMNEILHEDVVFAYPGRRLNKEQTMEDLKFFKESFADTKVYVHNIIIDGDMVAVEWQFASTLKETGKRQVVSDAIIGKIKDGKIIVWKEYLDGRVKTLQADGQLFLEEGEEPFPWPMKTELYETKK